MRSNLSHLKNYLIMVVATYVLMALYYMTIGYKETVAEYLEIGRLLLTFYFFSMIGLSMTAIKAKHLFYLNALCFLLVSLWMKYSYQISGLGYFGRGMDSYAVLGHTIRHADLSLFKFLKFMHREGYDAGDYGFFTIYYSLYHIYPDRMFLVYGMMVINVLCVFVSSHMIYNIQRRLNGNPNIGKLTAMLCCATPFMVVTNVNGLKEVIFMAIVVTEFYLIVRLQHRFNWFEFAAFVLLMLVSRLFRNAYHYIFLLVLLVTLVTNQKNRKLMLIIILSGAFLTSALLPIFLQVFLNMDLGALFYTADYRFTKVDNSNQFFVKIVPYIAGILGPFAKLDRVGTYAFLHSATIYLKSAFSWFFLVGVWNIIKRQDYRYYGMLIFVFLSIYMMIVAGVSLDIRFHWVYVPIFFIIALNFIKPRYVLDYGYLFALMVMIMMYSSRS